MNNTVIQFLLDMYVGGMLFLITAFLYVKLVVSPINPIYKNPVAIMLGSLVISSTYAIVYLNGSRTIAQIVSYLYPLLFFAAFEKRSVTSKCLTCFLLSGLTRILALLPTIVISFPLSLMSSDYLRYSIIVIYAMAFVLALLLTKIKRFRRGIQFFQDVNHMGFGIAVSGCVFCLFSIPFSYQKLENEFFVLSVIFGLVILGFGVYIWIRHSITAHYRETIKLQSEKHYQKQISESKTKNEKLMKSNEFLAKIVHRDNHLISALNTSIDDYFNSDDKSFKDDLLRDIQTLAKERTELIDKEQREAKILPSTGNLLFDSSINDLYFKAVAHGIDFDIDVSVPVDEIIGKYLSQTELQTLLCDHIKDAIIAVDAKGEGSGKILVSLSVKDNNYDITIFDSGIDFEIDTLSKLGKERVTTHAEDGGSGIGFMTTFETLKKSYASLIITENENKIPFSKSISIRFDGLSAFVIQSYRAEKLKSAIKREDITIV